MAIIIKIEIVILRCMIIHGNKEIVVCFTSITNYMEKHISCLTNFNYQLYGEAHQLLDKSSMTGKTSEVQPPWKNHIKEVGGSPFQSQRAEQEEILAEIFVSRLVISMETIQLPSLLHWYSSLGDEYYNKDCVLSSPPQRNGSSAVGDDPIVAFLIGTRRGVGKDILVYCRPGDEDWKTQKITDIYDLRDLRSMLYFKVSDDIRGYTVGGIYDTQTETYYVESFDEIFRIERIFLTRGVYEYYVTNMVIAKLDFSSMSWVEVKSLDDHVLFLSHSSALCCSTKELGFSRGCVYFTQIEEMSLYKYDLENKSIMLSLPCPDLPKPWFPPEWLMIPSTFR
ncbi:hypothetical protein C5167_028931 [Papaver somniferum]|nr:hypothetical protein C5167_028931 [Papaver somniferum]